MSGALRRVWEYLEGDIWEPLAAYAVGGASAPTSLYGDLYVASADYLAPPPMSTSLEEASNDPQRARELFLSLRGTDFANEMAIVKYLENVHELIGDYEIPGYAKRYTRLVRDAQVKYNLRYRVEEPFALRFLLPGSFANLYDELARRHAGNEHLMGLFAEFEKAFDAYLRDNDTFDLKICLMKAYNYAEGVASEEVKKPGQLGQLCDQLTVWPHAAIKQSLKSLHGFCSDYPGIRHAGNPNAARRDLDARDLTLVSLMLLSFSGYLSADIDEQAVLGT